MAARPVNMRLRESGMMPFTTYIRGMAEKRFSWPGMGGSAGLWACRRSFSLTGEPPARIEFLKSVRVLTLIRRPVL
jgi:hypothetical protein